MSSGYALLYHCDVFVVNFAASAFHSQNKLLAEVVHQLDELPWTYSGGSVKLYMSFSWVQLELQGLKLELDAVQLVSGAAQASGHFVSSV